MPKNNSYSELPTEVFHWHQVQHQHSQRSETKEAIKDETYQGNNGAKNTWDTLLQTVMQEKTLSKIQLPEEWIMFWQLSFHTKKKKVIHG